MRVQLKPRSAFAIAAVLIGSCTLLGSLTGCGGTATNAGAPAGEAGLAGGSNGNAGQGAANSGGTGGAAAGAAGVLDTSPTGGPCGQYVYDLDTYCGSASDGGICTSPDSAMLKELCAEEISHGHSMSVQSGCGYLFLQPALNEGDAELLVYDQSTQRLVFYSEIGPIAIGCAFHGERVGQMPPPCTALKDECVNSADAGVGGSG